jgi:CheY-like chemotaxis protein
MDGIYIIDDKLNIDIQQLTYQKIEYSKKKEASAFDKYVINLFEIHPSIQKLIIPVNLGETSNKKLNGLTLGLHIRLNNHIGSKKLIPLIFVGDEDLEELLLLTTNNLNNPVYLLATKGCVYCNKLSNLDDFVQNENGVEMYEKDVLNHLKLIQPEENGGKHSLANIWGALRLDEVLNLKAIKDESLKNRTKELYFKYLRAFHENNQNTNETEMDPFTYEGKDKEGKMVIKQSSIPCTYEKKDETDNIVIKQRKILYIDDEADKGWNDVLKAIFKDAYFQHIDFKNKTFEEAEKEATKRATKEDWDLILLDLRLNPSDEDTGDKLIKTEDYSGAKILKAIKDHNAGIQVIMLTASNKAWNMKKLLDLGADGYYIKESPEFNFSPAFTIESYEDFKKQVQGCFERGFLREIFVKTRNLKGKLESTKSKPPESFKTFIQDSRLKLDHTFYLLTLKNTQRTMEFALFNYFQILEDYAKLFTFPNDTEGTVIAYKAISDIKNRINPHKIYWKDKDKKYKDKEVETHYALTWDWYDFMKRKDENDKTITNIEFKDNPLVQETILSVSLKLAVILNIQLSDMLSIGQLNELIYIRNNTIVHSGLNFDKGKRKVEIEDIKLIFKLIYKLVYATF